MRFYTYRTYIDLGVFDQSFSTALHGRLFYETPDIIVIPSGSFLGTHFSPLMFLILPIYAVYPHPETLLILQTAFIALGAIPIYLTGVYVLRRQRISLALAAVYLLNPAIHSLNIFDFHLEAFLPFFLGMTYYFLLRRIWRRFLIFLGLALITIEFASIIMVAICVSVLLSNWKPLMNMILHPRNLFQRNEYGVLFPLFTIPVALGVFYLLLLGSAFIGGTGYSTGQLLGGFIVTSQAIESYAATILYWALLLGVPLFLPLLVPTRVLVVIPWVIVTFITEIPTFHAPGYQHAGAFAAPYLIFALIFALHKAATKLPVKSIFVGIFLLSVIFSPLNPLVQHKILGIAYEDGLPIPTTHDYTVARVIALVPSNASILTENDLFTHFSNRPDAYLYLPTNATRPLYILGDATSRWYTFHVFGAQSVSEVVGNVTSTKEYGVVARADGVTLLQRGYRGSTMSWLAVQDEVDPCTLCPYLSLAGKTGVLCEVRVLIVDAIVGSKEISS
jgi:uncharacterized membrane protein